MRVTLGNLLTILCEPVALGVELFELKSFLDKSVQLLFVSFFEGTDQIVVVLQSIVSIASMRSLV